MIEHFASQVTVMPSTEDTNLVANVLPATQISVIANLEPATQTGQHGKSSGVLLPGNRENKTELEQVVSNGSAPNGGDPRGEADATNAKTQPAPKGKENAKLRENISIVKDFAEQQ